MESFGEIAKKRKSNFSFPLYPMLRAKEMETGFSWRPVRREWDAQGGLGLPKTGYGGRRAVGTPECVHFCY